MTNSKIKSSTALIIALSVLLVLALATTVTLAYFSKSKTATTTITFGGGVDVTLTGVDNSANPTCWLTNNSDPDAGSYSDLSSEIKLSAITVKPTVSCYIAIRAQVWDGSAEETVTYGTGWTAWTGHDGWYLYGTATTPTEMDDTVARAAINEVTLGTDSNAVAGKTFTCKIAVVAIDSATGTTADLITEINKITGWNS